MLNNKNLINIVLILSLLLTFSCNKINRDKAVDKSKLLGADYRLFQDTPAWELAKAVWDNDVAKIDEEVNKNPQILNYQDPKYGKTLLHLSSYNDNYEAFKELLKLGANPDIADSSHCTTPLIEIAQSFDNKLKYAEELIKYKSDINYMECNNGKEEQKTNDTALMAASERGNLELVKLLLKNGAKINFTNSNEEYALSAAVLADKYNVILYLLQQGADCNKVLYKKGGAEDLKNIYFKDWINDDADHSAKEYSAIEELLRKKGCL
ncbi:ankyrin repeat domain-containing protein [Chryseobacterium sp. sg2396]|uniref:ankyrin repeat domain-containing protein n=1 Tax=Chryseobacterium sp. sg2396 TaxID=3276280 RepID=UPI003670C4C5